MFSENRSKKNEKAHKTYKNLFETMKKKPTKLYYSEKLITFKGNT